MRRIALGVALLSAGTLAFEITLTRLFAVAQWYHFAFMAVSVALLGFGASGTALTLWSAPVRRPWQWMHRLSLGFAVTTLLSYLIINYVPFDSYRIAWEPIQLGYLAIYYLALTTPFFLAGAVIGALLAADPYPSNQVYAANLSGSGLGAIIALVGLTWISPSGIVLIAAGVGVAAAIAFSPGHGSPVSAAAPEPEPRSTLHAWQFALYLLLAALFLGALVPPAVLDVRVSPYKTLSTLQRYPDTHITYTDWNAYSRVDAIESTTVRSYPGLSFSYVGDTPDQVGITIDGDNLTPITSTADEAALEFLDALPTALPYQLRSAPEVVVLDAGGGLDVLQALRQGAASVTAVDGNPLVVGLVRHQYDDYSGHLYSRPAVTLEVEHGRGFARRAVATGQQFDLVHVALADSFKVVNFGAYSLTESPTYTVDAFRDFWRLLRDDGILIVPRWLQLPPSESLRAAATAVAALAAEGVDHPAAHLVAYRTFKTMTLLVKREPFLPDEVQAVQRFVAQHGFDLVAAPGITSADANQHNVLEEPVYYTAFQRLLGPGRSEFIASYEYEITPPTDDRPFFFHFFRWSQIDEIVATFGKTWQPFGGSGYLVLLILLALATVTSVVLILLPLTVRRRLVEAEPGGQPRLVFAGTLFVFGALGIGFLFIEIPLIQQFVVFLGHPTLAFATVLLTVLVFSGLGSLLAPRVPLVPAFLVTALGAILYPVLLRPLLSAALATPLYIRIGAAVVSLAPLGVFMGVPFPRALTVLETVDPALTPWAWAINGCASVLSSILATMLAVSVGFSIVLAVAGGMYLVALLATVPLTQYHGPESTLERPALDESYSRAQ